MDSTEDTMQFAVGEHVVYPLQGVGVITRIEEQDFRGVDTMYYVIYLDISDMTVMIPVGMIVGPMMFIATASAQIRRHAPRIPEAGIRIR